MASWLAGGRSSEAEIYESAEVMQGNKMKNKIVLQFLVSVFLNLMRVLKRVKIPQSRAICSAQWLSKMYLKFHPATVMTWIEASSL